MQTDSTSNMLLSSRRTIIFATAAGARGRLSWTKYEHGEKKSMKAVYFVAKSTHSGADRMLCDLK